jgi:hypothetical protein
MPRQKTRRRRFDVLLCSDFVNLPDLRALFSPALRVVPVLYYLHENQMTYPLSPDETFDPYFGFTNVLSCSVGRGVAFNSDFHRRDFLKRLPDFLPRLSEYEPRWVVDDDRGQGGGAAGGLGCRGTGTLAAERSIAAE